MLHCNLYSCFRARRDQRPPCIGSQAYNHHKVPAQRHEIPKARPAMIEATNAIKCSNVNVQCIAELSFLGDSEFWGSFSLIRLLLNKPCNSYAKNNRVSYLILLGTKPLGNFGTFSNLHSEHRNLDTEPLLGILKPSPFRNLHWELLLGTSEHLYLEL